MTPYYEDGSVTLYHGDMLNFGAVVPSDIFVTDPPYSRAGGLHTGRQSSSGMAGDAVQSDQFWLHWFRDAARVLASFTKPTGCGFVFCDYRTVHLVERAFAGCAGWYVGQCLVWDREATGMGSPFRASHEMIAFVRGPNFQWAGPRNVRNVLRCRWPYNETPHHPAEKPVALISRLIELTLPLGGRVFDPFAGGGSTLVAARNIGRKAIGIEIDEHYCDVVRRRCSQEVLPLEAS